ncbi:MAG: glycosyltransferase family 4 protein [Verrucomicrobiota bacterium]
MRISFSATNPCHMWPTARAVAEAGALAHFYSGYPAWKIADANPAHLRCFSFRTNVVYGLLKYAPAALRPSARRLFLWQDRGFDRWVGAHLEPCDFIHAMPGQALHTFRAAKKLGIRTVLNHATGPAREWVRIMRPEYERVGMSLEKECPYDAAYFEREDEEYALADFHCAASTVVRDQLIATGIPAARVWVAPYGADTNSRVFRSAENPSAPPFFRILFAGQISLRKGIRTLLEALTLAGRAHWKMEFIGSRSAETAKDFAAYRGATPLTFHGALPQEHLARVMRDSSVLVLPSLEEGFGLVVPQALNCGCPCIVSDRTGGKDCIRHRENGSVFPVGDAASLAAELAWWERNPGRTSDNFTWTKGARTIIAESEAALSR